MSHHRQEDHRTTLVDGRLVSVEQCACGTVHLTIGAITMRLQRDAFSEVADALTIAARALDERPLRLLDDRFVS